MNFLKLVGRVALYIMLGTAIGATLISFGVSVIAIFVAFSIKALLFAVGLFIVLCLFIAAIIRWNGYVYDNPIDSE